MVCQDVALTDASAILRDSHFIHQCIYRSEFGAWIKTDKLFLIVFSFKNIKWSISQIRFLHCAAQVHQRTMVTLFSKFQGFSPVCWGTNGIHSLYHSNDIPYRSRVKSGHSCYKVLQTPITRYAHYSWVVYRGSLSSVQQFSRHMPSPLLLIPTGLMTAPNYWEISLNFYLPLLPMLCMVPCRYLWSLFEVTRRKTRFSLYYGNCSPFWWAYYYPNLWANFIEWKLSNVYSLLQNTATTRSQAVKVFSQCIENLYMVKDQYPQATKEAVSSILPSWVITFHQLLQEDPRGLASQNELWGHWLIRLEVYRVCYFPLLLSRITNSYSP